MTQPGIEPQFPGPLANTLIIMPMGIYVVTNNFAKSNYILSQIVYMCCSGMLSQEKYEFKFII